MPGVVLRGHDGRLGRELEAASKRGTRSSKERGRVGDIPEAMFAIAIAREAQERLVRALAAL